MDSKLPQHETKEGEKTEIQATKNKSGNRILSSFLIVVVIAGLTASTWLYQQHKIDDLQQNATVLQTDKQKISGELAALKQEMNNQKQNKTSVSYSDVIMDTDTFGRYGQGKAAVIVIRFTAENKGTGTQQLKASDFNLKTLTGNVLAGYADSPELMDSVKAFGLPDNLSEFNNYMLKVGEKVNGSLAFWDDDNTVTDFIIAYNGESTNLKVTETTKVCTREGSICN